MKEYNRKTKKWEEKTTEKVDDLKKSKLCKGKRPHKMRLVLPDHIMRVNRDLTDEIILAWYESKERVYNFIQSEEEKMKSLGLTDRSWNHKTHKDFECEECGKKHYEFKD